VLDAGVAPQPGAERPAGVVRTGLRPSRNLAVEAALDDDQVDVALATGRRMANDARARGANVLFGGDMGVASTNPRPAWQPGSRSRRGGGLRPGHRRRRSRVYRKRAVGPEPAHGLLLDHLGLEPLLDPRMRLGQASAAAVALAIRGWPARCTPGRPPSTRPTSPDRHRDRRWSCRGRLPHAPANRCRRADGRGPSRAAAWFPVVGLLVGGVMAATRALAGLVLDPVPSTASPCWPPWW
jgi:Phosphoribosyltransferase